jgi:hypothetical protein
MVELGQDLVGGLVDRLEAAKVALDKRSLGAGRSTLYAA